MSCLDEDVAHGRAIVDGPTLHDVAQRMTKLLQRNAHQLSHHGNVPRSPPAGLHDHGWPRSGSHRLEPILGLGAGNMISTLAPTHWRPFTHNRIHTSFSAATSLRRAGPRSRPFVLVTLRALRLDRRPSPSAAHTEAENDEKHQHEPALTTPRPLRDDFGDSNDYSHARSGHPCVRYALPHNSRSPPLDGLRSINAAAEAFFSTLEHEVLARHRFATKARARKVVVA